MRPLRSFLIATALTYVFAYTPGGFSDGGSTLVSAMMMFLGNENSVYVLDKAEGNSAQVNGHPWCLHRDINTRKAIVMDIRTNSFCASGMHLPNGSFVTFGGNDGITVGGKVGSQQNPDGTGYWDTKYQDFDGRRSIRIVKPCKISDDLNGATCKWFDEPDQLAMKKRRWYSTAEPNAEGRIILIGGMTAGGYINRELPNTDPITEHGQAEPTYEYFPAMDGDPPNLDFIIRTSGLNAYPHTFLMPSGRILLQANISTALWNDTSNTDTPLPDMPNGIVRVYPASGATAMLPLTPSNKWTPTLLFCGGTTMGDNDWGNYGGPNAATWNIVASTDCQRLTPEPLDGSTPAYEQDDDMLEPRTLSQFILLPTGKMLLINGALNGTGGYSKTPTPFDLSLASGPVLTPVIYDPTAPKGSRWSRQGLSASQIPRLYHSSAILLPDGSVLIAGSNPNPDVNTTSFYPTEYRAEIFYPPYFSSSLRPSPLNLPQTLQYGGSSFDVVLLNSSYSGDPNVIADQIVVNLVRPGFATHAMNMGQRFMQLNNTYTVYNNGTIVLHVAQLPPNPNLFQPGPALIFVVIDGIPSTGKLVTIGNGNIGPQPISTATMLPDPVKRTNATTTINPPTDTPFEDKTSKTPYIAGIASALGLAGLLLGLLGYAYYRSKKTGKSTFGLFGSKHKRDLEDVPEPKSGPSDLDLAPLTDGSPVAEGISEDGSISVIADTPITGRRLSQYPAERSASQLYTASEYDPYSSDLLGQPKEIDSNHNLIPPMMGGGYISRADSSEVSSAQASYRHLPDTLDSNTSERSPLSQS